MDRRALPDVRSCGGADATAELASLKLYGRDSPSGSDCRIGWRKAAEGSQQVPCRREVLRLPTGQIETCLRKLVPVLGE